VGVGDLKKLFNTEPDDFFLPLLTTREEEAIRSGNSIELRFASPSLFELQDNVAGKCDTCFGDEETPFQIRKAQRRLVLVKQIILKRGRRDE
jgi:hypothetical protein